MEPRKKYHSRLDPYAKQLDQWLTGAEDGGDHLSFQEVVKRLAEKHQLSVTPATLSLWWKKRRQRLSRDLMLERIRDSSARTRELTERFERDPAPELDTIMKLLRVLIVNVSEEAMLEPHMLDLVLRTLQPVLAHARLQIQQQDHVISQRKLELLQFDAAQDTLSVLPKLKQIGYDETLDRETKTEAIRIALFGDAAL